VYGEGSMGESASTKRYMGKVRALRHIPGLSNRTTKEIRRRRSERKSRADHE
jgi:hypothetical protein